MEALECLGACSSNSNTAATVGTRNVLTPFEWLRKRYSQANIFASSEASLQFEVLRVFS